MAEDETDAIIAASILRHGWHCLLVGADEDGQEPYACSIGFTERFGAPEVLVFGLPETVAHAVLARCAEVLQSGGELLPFTDRAGLLDGDYLARLQPLRGDCYDEYLARARHYYGERPFTALVLLWPDRQYRFPGDDGFDASAQHEALTVLGRSFPASP